jgi:type I restriction enzyme S subunit
MIKRPQHDARWRSVKLGEVIQVKHGYAFQGQFFAGSGPYVLLTPGNVEEGGGFRLRGTKEKFYVGEVDQDYVLNEGDLIVVMTEQAEGLLGSSALIPGSGRFLHNQRLGLVLPLRANEVDTRFLYHLFNYREVRAQIRASASGVKVRHTSPSRISEVKVKLPPLGVQQRIADILCCYEDLIANNRRRIAILDEVARTIYREWFVEFRAAGTRLRRAATAERKATGKDVLPEGWEVKPIGEVVETLGGGTPSTKEDEYWKDGDITWFTPSDLTATGSMFIGESEKRITRVGLERSSAQLFPRYSVMMTSRATIGVTAINTEEACTNQGFITSIPNERLSAWQIYFWIEEHKDQIISIASGATYKEINRTEFRGMPILVADQGVSARFVDAVSPLAGQIENLLVRNDSLRRTREFLLPRLVSGEVSVDDVKIANADSSIRQIREVSR